jgi:hypothetical protein
VVSYHDPSDYRTRLGCGRLVSLSDSGGHYDWQCLRSCSVSTRHNTLACSNDMGVHYVCLRHARLSRVMDSRLSRVMDWRDCLQAVKMSHLGVFIIYFGWDDVCPLWTEPHCHVTHLVPATLTHGPRCLLFLRPVVPILVSSLLDLNVLNHHGTWRSMANSQQSSLFATASPFS